jgi:hypothetical protein
LQNYFKEFDFSEILMYNKALVGNCIHKGVDSK